jgi:hypothetical protein
LMAGYNQPMARGWESKSIEAQQEEAAARTAERKPRLSPEEATRLRERENLRLSLQNIVQQLDRCHDARHRAMLEQAKADLESRIEQLSK